MRTSRVFFWVIWAAAALAAAAAAGEDGSLRRRSVSVCRQHRSSVADFGAVPDGKTSNTAAFRAAVANLSGLAGGAQLEVPAGRWVTGPFNLTSHFTLFLHRDAVILASNDMSEWPAIDALPSYGRGRDLPGPRYSNFISGANLTDVVITGNNGTIDGQGKMWWNLFKKNQLTHTRGYLLELMFSDQILISNLTFSNSPSWTIHPVYSTNVVISGVTVLAPVDSPSTDGIDPDSCSSVKIENVFIVSGDDCIAIKSGWDEYGIAFGKPTEHVVIRNLTCISPTSAVIALGSEMSGGIRDVRAEGITALSSESGVRIKTAVGRGGYVNDVYVRGMALHTMRWVFWMNGNYGQHPDGGFDPDAVPSVGQISYSDVVADDVGMVGELAGIPGAPFTGICMSNVTAEVAVAAAGTMSKKKKLHAWNCTDIAGISSGVSPAACSLLPDAGYGVTTACPFPEDKLPIDYLDFVDC